MRVVVWTCRISGGNGLGGNWLSWLLGTGLFLILVLASDARTWKSRDGKQVEGDYVSLESGKVLIRRAKTDAVVEIPFDRLSEDDQKFVEERLAEAKQEGKTTTGSSKTKDETPTKLTPDGDAIDIMLAHVPFADYLIGTGWAVTLIWGALLFSLHVVFLHISTHMLSFRGHVSDAVKAGGLELLLMGIVIAASAGAITFVGELGVLLLFGVFLAGPIAVLVIYERELLLSVLAYLLSLVLTAIANAGFFLALGAIRS